MASSSQNLHLTQQQRLQQRLSPQQVQYVHMLEMNRTELEEAVRAELDDNPALEKVEAEYIDNRDDEGHDYTESSDELLRADYNDPDDIPMYRYNSDNFDPDYEPREAVLVEESSIFDLLRMQIDERNLSDEQKLIAGYVIGNIDNNGYLQRSASAIADDIAMQTGFMPEASEVEAVIAIVQSLDPPGVAARNLRECLLLQLSRRAVTSNSQLIGDATQIVNQYFDDFFKKHYDRMHSLLGVSKQRADEAIALIRSLNPKPGNVIAGSTSDDLKQQIIPDFNVDIENNNQLKLTLLNNIPELQIEKTFADMNEAYAGRSTRTNRRESEAVAFVRQKYDDANNFIKILKQTTATLYSVGAAILNRQREFFLSGDEMTLRPMVLKDVADDTGLDISVVSRAASGKYINTQWGVYSLKFFFNEGLGHSRGEEASSREIQSILKQVINDENKKQPLSDEQLCAILQRHGYDIARRTIAKYRKILNIPVARLRREV